MQVEGCEGGDGDGAFSACRGPGWGRSGSLRGVCHNGRANTGLGVECQEVFIDRVMRPERNTSFFASWRAIYWVTHEGCTG